MDMSPINLLSQVYMLQYSAPVLLVRMFWRLYSTFQQVKITYTALVTLSCILFFFFHKPVATEMNYSCSNHKVIASISVQCGNKCHTALFCPPLINLNMYLMALLWLTSTIETAYNDPCALRSYNNLAAFSISNVKQVLEVLGYSSWLLRNLYLDWSIGKLRKPLQTSWPSTASSIEWSLLRTSVVLTVCYGNLCCPDVLMADGGQ